MGTATAVNHNDARRHGPSQPIVWLNGRHRRIDCCFILIHPSRFGIGMVDGRGVVLRNAYSPYCPIPRYGHAGGPLWPYRPNLMGGVWRWSPQPVLFS
jgi:hypothetical protein